MSRTAMEVDHGGSDGGVVPASSAPPTNVHSDATSTSIQPTASARRKHALSVAAPAGSLLSVMLSPNSEAKRHRSGAGTGDTPLGSVGLSGGVPPLQWAAEVPMSPATSLMAHGMASVHFGSGPSPPPARATNGNGNGSAHGTPPKHSGAPPSPGPLVLAAPSHLPPTHPVVAPSQPHAHMSPSAASSRSRSSSTSSASSPSTFSLGSTAAASTISSSSAASLDLSPSPALGTGTLRLSGALAQAAALVGLGHVDEVDDVLEAQADDVEDEEVDELAHHQPQPQQHHNGLTSNSKKKALPPPPPVMSAAAAALDNRQGASCHQCKTTKVEQHLLFCTTKAGGSRKRRCRKKYCENCLLRTYGASMAHLQAVAQNGANWQCPSCLGTCTCAGCTRKGGRVPVAAQPAAAPAVPQDLPATTAPTTLPPKRDKRTNAAAATVAAAAAAADAWPHGTLPASSLLDGRAVSAPNFGAEATQKTSRLAVDPAQQPQSQQPSSIVSPPNLDAIASLLLELSTTSASTSSAMPSSTASEEQSEFAPATTSSSPSTTAIGSNFGASTFAPQMQQMPLSARAPVSTRMGLLGSPSSASTSYGVLPFTFSSLGGPAPASSPPPRAATASLFPQSSVGLAKRFAEYPSLLAASTSAASASASPIATASPHMPLFASKFGMLPAASAYPPRAGSEHSALHQPLQPRSALFAGSTVPYPHAPLRTQHQL